DDRTHQTQHLVGGGFSPVAEARPVQPQVAAGRSHGADACLGHLAHRIALVPRAYHFFAFTCSRTRMFKTWSATIFFSSAFSRSSSFRRLTSRSSIWPYLRFQRWRLALLMLWSRQTSST